MSKKNWAMFRDYLEDLRQTHKEDHWNCKDQFHDLQTHADYHAVLKSFDDIFELVEKAEDQEAQLA
jgi:hypothetical protein|tara:strand:- start:2301 stop:2498 length:198 start_codon:yes stop_codon:yes gene_type:complete